MISMAECHLRRSLLFLDGGDELVCVGMGACDSTVQLIVPPFYGIVGAGLIRVDVPHAERKVPVQPGMLVVVQQIGERWVLDYYGVCCQLGDCRAYDNDWQECHTHEFPHHSENTYLYVHNVY